MLLFLTFLGAACDVTLFLYLQVTASYVLTLDNRLLVTFGATTDKVTAAVCGPMVFIATTV